MKILLYFFFFIRCEKVVYNKTKVNNNKLMNRYMVNKTLTSKSDNATMIIQDKKEVVVMYAMDFAQVGANIQEKLYSKGMTQQSLANALGISKQVMNKIIKGSKAINVNELAKIASVMGITTDELLMVDSAPVALESLSFMGNVTDENTLERVNMIRVAIDEIHMLEELLNA